MRETIKYLVFTLVCFKKSTRAVIFFKEINAIATTSGNISVENHNIPIVLNVPQLLHAQPKEDGRHTLPNCPWQECFDESSGYAYYWNIKTNEVTWQCPDEYKLYKDTIGHLQQVPSSAQPAGPPSHQVAQCAPPFAGPSKTTSDKMPSSLKNEG